jgi:hypothetical protein
MTKNEILQTLCSITISCRAFWSGYQIYIFDQTCYKKLFSLFSVCLLLIFCFDKLVAPLTRTVKNWYSTHKYIFLIEDSKYFQTKYCIKRPGLSIGTVHCLQMCFCSCYIFLWSVRFICELWCGAGHSTGLRFVIPRCDARFSWFGAFYSVNL